MAIGLVFLFFGGEALVRGATTLATRLGMAPLLVGLVIVGFGTSTPELLVSIRAALDGAQDIAAGNVVGSNIANIMLIGGLAAFLCPFPARGQFPHRDIVAMIAAAAVLMGLALFGEVSRWVGAALVVALAAYLIFTYRVSKRESHDETTAPQRGGLRAAFSVLLALVFVVVGIAGLVQGANLLVFGATETARDWGVSEAVIGLTIVAVGTSLPELATAIIAAIRRQSAIAIGNIIGSNIFNVFAILGLTAIVQPLTITPGMAQLDAPIMLGVTLAASLLLIVCTRIGKGIGLAALVCYAAYLTFLFA